MLFLCITRGDLPLPGLSPRKGKTSRLPLHPLGSNNSIGKKEIGGVHVGVYYEPLGSLNLDLMMGEGKTEGLQFNV